MSNNIYNILGKLESLTPKEEPKQETTQSVYESVEARGSVLEGVAKIEARLAQALEETRSVDEAVRPDFLQKVQGWEAQAKAEREKAQQQKPYGVKDMAKDLGKLARGDIKGGLSEEEMMEKAPPGMEDMVMKLKKQYPSEPEKAFATAWSIYNKKHSKKEEGVEEGKASHNFSPDDLKRLEGIKDLPTLKAQAFELISKPSARPMKPEKVEWFKQKLETLNSPFKVIKLMYDLLLSGEGQAVIGSKSSMNPNTYRRTFGESDYDVKDTGYSKIYQRKVKDTDLDADDEDDKPAVKTKGRPKKADKEKSQASLPWGGKPPKTDANPTKKWPKEKTRVHKISEGVNFKRMAEETGMTLEEMLKCLSDDMSAYKETGHMTEMLRDCMEVFGHGKKQLADEDQEMTLEAVSRKHFQQVADLLRSIEDPEKRREMALHHAHIFKQQNPRFDQARFFQAAGLDEGALGAGIGAGLGALAGGPLGAVAGGALGKAVTDEAADNGIGGKFPPVNVPGKMAALTPPKPGFIGGVKHGIKDTVKGIMGRDDVEHFGTGKSLDEELNELASLAGLSVADEEIEQEGNAFGKAVRTAKADGIQKGEKVAVGGREYPVKETTTLEDIAKLSGIAIEGKDYGDTEIEDKETRRQYANAPDEEVEGEEVLTKGGDGEVAGKEKAMHADKPTWKNADNPLTKESVNPIESLGRKLMAAYESIKLSK